MDFMILGIGKLMMDKHLYLLNEFFMVHNTPSEFQIIIKIIMAL